MAVLDGGDQIPHRLSLPHPDVLNGANSKLAEHPRRRAHSDEIDLSKIVCR